MIENVQTIKAHDPDSRYEGEPEENESRPENPLDSEESNRTHKRCLEWYQQERERQAENRYQMALDEDYYDHLQTWSEEELQELRARGQAPLVFNLIKPTIDWIIGTEKRTRFDWKVHPREEDDNDGAVLKTKLLKYLSDVNRTPFEISRAFAEQVKAGLGWMEDTITPDFEEEMLYSRAESWRNVLHDSTSRAIDYGDARYQFRWRWLDTDIAKAFWPERAAQIDSASVSQDLFGPENDDDMWYLGQHFTRLGTDGSPIGLRTYVSDANLINRRVRVKLIECWFKMPKVCEVCTGHDQLEGQVFSADNPNMAAALRAGQIDVIRKVKMRTHVAVFTEGDMIAVGMSPFRHNKFPLTPLWCYRRARDGMPYGAIRGLRDPQDDYNKRSSKALFMLSTNRVIADKGAVDDFNKLVEEAARPDMAIEKVAGKEIRIENNAQLAEGHIMLMERDGVHIQRSSGATSENLGISKNATSGKAILALQEQGSVITAEIFDNTLLAHQLMGEKRLSNIEQFYTAPKVFRITGGNKDEFIKINQYDPHTEEWLNDITKSKADYIVGEQDFRQTLRMAMFETLSEMVAKQPPEVGLQLIDIVVGLMDLPDKDKVLKRLRKISGNFDEDDIKTPEDKKAIEGKRRADEKQGAIQEALVIKQLEKLTADVERMRAQTKAANVGATASAASAAETLAQHPLLMRIAQAILQEAQPLDEQTAPSPAPMEPGLPAEPGMTGGMT